MVKNWALDPGEKILWQGRPRFLPFIFDYLYRIKFGVILAIAVPLLVSMVIFDFADGETLALLIALTIIAFLAAYYMYAHLQYTITNRRIILRRGSFTGTNFLNFEYDWIPLEQIQRVDTRYTFFDNIFRHRTGSLLIHAGRKVYSEIGIDVAFEPKRWKKAEQEEKTNTISFPIYNINNPEQVLNLLWTKKSKN